MLFIHKIRRNQNAKLPTKKNNPYILPSNLYMRMLYLVRDYNRLKEEYANIIHEMPHNDGMPKGNMTGDPTLESFKNRIHKQKLEQLNKLYTKYLRNIEKACSIIYATEINFQL